MPRVIFCLHALSLFLFKLGITPQMQDLVGKVTFTDEELTTVKSALDEYNVQMPQFRQLGGMLEGETQGRINSPLAAGGNNNHHHHHKPVMSSNLTPSRKTHQPKVASDEDEFEVGIDTKALVYFQVRTRR